MTDVQNKVETRKFDAEVGKVLQLMIHSLYTNKDIFLRELISNASDACDKLRYQALTNADLLKEDTELGITIAIDDKKRELTITDNGIGMSHDDLIDQLGTVARSGTQAFVEQLTGDKKKDIQLIGQFGVGFYSSFMVADFVTVVSRKAGEEKAHIWKSDGTGEFTIEEAENTHPRGTTITLHIKEDLNDYLDKHRIKHITTTYSDHVPLPITLIDEEDKIEVINSGSALWTLPKSEITDEQYKSFYNHVAHAGDDPWMILHNKNEGTLEYTNLLFIPTVKPFDLFHPDRKCRIKLYVKRVFITEDGVDLVPQYLRFVRGMIDSQDLPLNISRETLQHNAMIHRIRKATTKKILNELKKKAKDDPESYAKFWNNFGAVVKEGLCDATEDREAILEVCRFKSTHSEDGTISLADYLDRLKEDQETIYYLTGDNYESLKNSPQLEGFKKRGIEVLLLTDSVDDFWVTVALEYKGRNFKSVTRADIDLDNLKKDNENTEVSAEEKQKAKETPAEHKALVEFVRDTLKDKVADVRVSGKLTDSPVCLAVSEFGMDIRMERFLVEQKQLPAASAKILEVNPNHPIIAALAKDINSDAGKERAQDVIFMLFDEACIIEGETVSDTGAFSSRLNNFITKALNAA